MIKQQSAFHSAQRLCGAFSLSPSSYYRWLKYPVGKRQREDLALSEDIKRIFKKSRSTYGSPRMQRTLREEGKRHGKKRLGRLMKKLKLVPKAARRFKVTTDSNHNKPAVAPNILGQRFSPSVANIAWATDITYIRTNEGWLYLATVIDLQQKNYWLEHGHPSIDQVGRRRRFFHGSPATEATPGSNSSFGSWLPVL